MTAIAERWATGRPIYSLLPGVNEPYQTEVADWLTAFSDAVLTRSKFGTVDDGARQVDPLKCDARWLDLLAPLCGWYGYWDKSWPEASKRQLLANSYTKIWPYHGTTSALSFVLTVLGVSHVITQGESFIIGRNKIGDEIGDVAWQYDVTLPTSLYNSPQEILARRINKFFGPLWCKSEILFSDDYFKAEGIVVIGNDSVLDVDNRQTILKV